MSDELLFVHYIQDGDVSFGARFNKELFNNTSSQHTDAASTLEHEGSMGCQRKPISSLPCSDYRTVKEIHTMSNR